MIRKIKKIQKIKKAVKIRKIQKIKRIDKSIYLLTIPANYDIKLVGITQSLIMAYKKCKRLFLYKLNRYANLKDNYKTSFGSLVHFVLEKLYVNRKFRALILTDPFNYVKLYIKEYEIEEKESLINIDTQTWVNEKALCLAIMCIYVRHYSEDFKFKTFVNVEDEIKHTFDFFTLLMKSDGKFKTSSDKLSMIEHKTMGRINEDNIQKRLSYDFQNQYYIKGDEVCYDESIDETLYNIIRKPQLRRGKKETLKVFIKRVSDDIKKRPEFYFIRFKIPYIEKDKKQFNKELDAVLSGILFDINVVKHENKLFEGADALQVFYKNESCCEHPWPCSFINACSSGSLAGYKQKDKLFSELNSVKEPLWQ